MKIVTIGTEHFRIVPEKHYFAIPVKKFYEVCQENASDVSLIHLISENTGATLGFEAYGYCNVSGGYWKFHSQIVDRVTYIRDNWFMFIFNSEKDQL